MTISYPLSLPTNVSFKRLTLTTDSQVAMQQSAFTGQTQVFVHQGEVWFAEVTLPDMARANAEEWIAFLLKLNGPQGTFYLGDPLGKTARGSVSGTPRVNGGSQTGRSLVTDGWSTNASGVLLAGDYIQLGQRLHKVLSDVDADGSGNATLDIWPRIRESPADNDTIITSSPKGIFRLVDKNVEIFGSDENQVYSIGFAAREAL